MSESPVGIGVIGAGGIARRKTIPGLSRAGNCRLAAVMDPVGVEEIAREFGVARAYAREEGLLADPEVEAVYIASPVDCHARQIRLAAEAGKHVLCEKPLARNRREGEAAVAVCRDRGVVLHEGYMMKFHGAHRRIREWIDQGRLGRIVSMRAQLSCWYPPIDDAWRQDPARGGGGALIDMATHLFDLLEYFAGPARRVAAVTDNLVQPYPSEDASTTLLRFESGAMATVDCFFCIPDEASRTRLEIYGSRGALLSEGTIGQGAGGRLEGIAGLGDARYDSTQNKDAVRVFEEIAFPAVNPYTAECEHFAECVRLGRESPLHGGANALRVLRLTDAAYESARSGWFVDV